MLNEVDGGYEIKGQHFSVEEAKQLRDELAAALPLPNDEFIDRINAAHGVQ